MVDIARPFLVVYIVWHPDFEGGAAVAEVLRKHFRRELYANVAGGTGLSVIFRSEPAPDAGRPLPIDLGEAETTAIVVLSESSLANDADWMAYIRGLSEQTDAAGLAARLFPVAIERAGLVVAEQALRWDQWSETLAGDKLLLRLISELTYEFCRMLRHYLEHLRRPGEDSEAIVRYLQKVQIFLSHSKHDDDGERIARSIREHLHVGHGLGSFFDVHDIPAGLRFNEVLLKQVAQSAVVAIHTDSYSSREWCRREIIEAKRRNVPLVVANCIGDQDERAFPYMGNVPIVRMDPQLADRIDVVVGRLLDEVLKDFLWRCRVELERGGERDVVFVPRAPELISLAGLPPVAEMAQPTIVYPDPPLSAEEERLFETVAPHVRLRSFTEWIAEEI
ncbi:toll/interleukin-1 receptor domain-containing protein [Burkholderia cepacia]|uniref:toll/interleukin-1 receptor domain-containing protein n=1 Tax=Burkholderia cepacia TaxID=292 RepID=UPI001F245881|nr:toll/interleukin-1 receptor domain-containing protein [Burkholderia cepacia]MCE4124541.1 toll/interleukin-1 receptor domain-containing protein [Burkholderia cepacia]